MWLLYIRYIPVLHVQSVDCTSLDKEKTNIIDIRDYNVSNHSPIFGAKNIPIAYLNRNLNEIPKEKLHIIASGPLEKNVGIRYLRQKGYQVDGYTIIERNHLKSC